MSERLPRLFISYARDDDSDFVCKLYEDLRKHGFTVWYDRESMSSRGLPFRQEILSSISNSDRFILVVGPHAAVSVHVAQEWQFAWYQAESVVTPILRCGGLELVPQPLQQLHCEDFTQDTDYDAAFRRLVNSILAPPPRRGPLIDVPSLPPHFLTRNEHLEDIRTSLRTDLETPVVIAGAAARVGLHGMAGIGKTVLAAAVAHDRLTRETFPDGILWIPLRRTQCILDAMCAAHRALGGDGLLNTTNEAQGELKQLLRDQAVLLVLDNVWSRAEVDAFDVLGPRCRCLMTTRDSGLLSALGGPVHVVPLLSDADAVQLLSMASKIQCDDLPIDATAILSECGHLPLAITLCGGILRRDADATALLTQLQLARIDRIAERHPVEEQHRSVWHAIHVSVELLPDDERARFFDLAVFPAAEPIPEVAVATLWQHVAQFDSWRTAESLALLAERSLINRAPFDNRPPSGLRYQRHELIDDYLRFECRDEMTTRHATLIEAYRRICKVGWTSGPNDGYFFEQLAWHLEQAGLHDELHALLAEEGPERSNAWFTARNCQGQLAGFLTDVTRAWDLAKSAGLYDLQCRYALMTASIHSVASQLSVRTVYELTVSGVWSPQHGLTLALNIPDSKERARAIACLAPHLDGPLAEEALREACKLSDPLDRLVAIVALSPSLPNFDRGWNEALGAVEHIGYALDRVQALLGLSLFARGPQRKILIEEAIETASKEAKAAQGDLIQAFQQLVSGEDVENSRDLVSTFKHTLRERSEALSALVGCFLEVDDFDSICAVFDALDQHSVLTKLFRTLPQLFQRMLVPLIRSAARKCSDSRRRDQVLGVGRLLAFLQLPDFERFDHVFIRNTVEIHRTAGKDPGDADMTSETLLIKGAFTLLSNLNSLLPTRYRHSSFRELKQWIANGLHEDVAKLWSGRTFRIGESGYGYGVAFDEEYSLEGFERRIDIEELTTVLISRLASTRYWEHCAAMVHLLGSQNIVKGLAHIARDKDQIYKPHPRFRDFGVLWWERELDVLLIAFSTAWHAIQRCGTWWLVRILLPRPLQHIPWIRNRLFRLIAGVRLESERTQTILTCIERLGPTATAPLLLLARDLQCPFYRAHALSGLLPYLDVETRGEVRADIVTALKSPINDVDAATVISTVSPYLDERSYSEAVTISIEMEDVWSRFRALQALRAGQRGDGTEIRTVADVPRRDVEDSEVREFVIACITPHRSWNRLHTVQQTPLRGIRRARLDRARFALVKSLVKHSDWDRAVAEARVIHDLNYKLAALHQVVSTAPKGGPSELAMEVVYECLQSQTSAIDLVQVAEFLPYASGETLHRLFKSAVYGARRAYEDDKKCNAIGCIVSQLTTAVSTNLLEEAVLVVVDVKDDKQRDSVLKQLCREFIRLGAVELSTESAKRITALGCRGRVVAEIQKAVCGENEWSVVALHEQLMHALEAQSDPWTRAGDLIELCDVDARVCPVALGVIRELPGFSNQLAKLRELLPRTSVEFADVVASELLDCASRSERPLDVARAFVPNLAAWPERSRAQALTVAIEAVGKVTNPVERCGLLFALSQCVDGRQRAELVDEAVQSASAIVNPEKRVSALLQARANDAALDCAVGISNAEKKCDALESLLPSVGPAQKEKIASLLLALHEEHATSYSFRERRKKCVVSLADAGCLSAACQLACSIDDRSDRSSALLTLSPRIVEAGRVEAAHALSLCLRLLSRRTREELLIDLCEMSEAFHVYDPSLGDWISDSIEEVGRWWP